MCLFVDANRKDLSTTIRFPGQNCIVIVIVIQIIILMFPTTNLFLFLSLSFHFFFFLSLFSFHFKGNAAVHRLTQSQLCSVFIIFFNFFFIILFISSVYFDFVCSVVFHHFFPFKVRLEQFFNLLIQSLQILSVNFPLEDFKK
jgi:hypothetical protein